MDFKAIRQKIIAAKRRKPGHLVLTRLGGFWEALDEDAHVVARELERSIGKNNGTVYCGVPFHAIDAAIDTLNRKGYRVELINA